jgi:hypothetical protein
MIIKNEQRVIEEQLLDLLDLLLAIADFLLENA